MRASSIITLVLTAISATAVHAQLVQLRPEVQQSITLFYSSRANVDKAKKALAELSAAASDAERKKYLAAVDEAEEYRDAALRSLVGKDQLAISLAHLHAQKAASIARLTQNSHRTVAAFFSRRRNVQSGESAATGGSTSLTSLTNVTEWVSAAFESGALARESSGTITTLRFSGYGIYAWLSPQNERPCAISNPVCDTRTEMHLRGLSGSVSIDNSTPGQNVSQPTQSNVTPAPIVNLLRGGGKIASANARFQWLQRVTPGTEAEIADWRQRLKKVEPEAADFTLMLDKFSRKLNSESDVFDGWRKRVRGAIGEPDPKEFERQYAVILTDLYAAQSSLLETLQPLEDARMAFQRKLAKELGEALLKPALALEYVYAGPSGAQSTSGLRFLADTKLFRTSVGGADDVDKDNSGTLTANASLNWYNDIPTGIKSGRMRDVQISAQFERAIGSVERKLRSSVSAAVYYQYQVNPAILTFNQNAVTPGPSGIAIPQPAAAALDSKGHIGIVQGKLTLRLTDAISIPLAVSWANRTELIKASTVRGQFGLNIDLGTLLNK